MQRQQQLQKIQILFKNNNFIQILNIDSHLFFRKIQILITFVNLHLKRGDKKNSNSMHIRCETAVCFFRRLVD